MQQLSTPSTMRSAPRSPTAKRTPATLGNRRRQQAGFTLVEMAIVLVIIGLLLGGVLKGQELVVQARVKSLINDFNQTTAAFYTYFDRYHRFPGDDKTAATRWPAGTPATAAACVGDGTGVIGTANTGYDTGTENKCIWQQLRISGIVSGDVNSVELPLNSVGGVTGIQEGAFGLTATVICTSNLPAKLAELIDFAIDDGDAKTGILRSATAIAATAPTVAYSAATTSLIACRQL